MSKWDKLRMPEKEFGLPKKKIEYVKCPCGSGHDIVKGSIINRCPLLYVKIIAETSRPSRTIGTPIENSNRREERTIYYEKPKPAPVDEEMNRAWDHFVESGDFAAVRNLREQRELSNWFMNRWD